MPLTEGGKLRAEDVEINRVLLEFPLYTAEQVQLEVAARGFKVTVEHVESWMQQ